jgi:hypothetical protein
MSATICWIAPRSAIGRPKVLRSSAWRVAISSPGRDAEGHRGVAAALDVEAVHQAAEFAGADDHILVGDDAILEDQIGAWEAAQAHEALLRAEAEAGCALLDQDPADPLGAARFAHAAVDEIRATVPPRCLASRRASSRHRPSRPACEGP